MTIYDNYTTVIIYNTEIQKAPTVDNEGTLSTYKVNYQKPSHPGSENIKLSALNAVKEYRQNLEIAGTKALEEHANVALEAFDQYEAEKPKQWRKWVVFAATLTGAATLTVANIWRRSHLSENDMSKYSSL